MKMIFLRGGWLPGLVLLLAACGSGTTDGQPDPGGPPVGGRPNPFSGTMVAAGSSQVLTIDLSADGQWIERLDSSVYETLAVQPERNELLAASVSFGSPLIVRSYSLANYSLTDTFVWPDSDTRDVGRVNGLAVSPNGTHLAAVLEGLGEPFLEIVERDTKLIRFTGYLGMTGSDLLWLSDDLLVLSTHIDDPAGEVAGGIVTVSLTELASGSETVTLNLLVGFGTDEWAAAKPFDFTFSHDRTQIAYAWNSDIWVKSLTDNSPPHQLTTGPSGLVGPAFSPDGNAIALVEYQRYTLRDTFIIPNHRHDPLFIDGTSAGTQAFLLEAATLVNEIMLWE